ncbi:MAG: hypothetical protein WDO13_15910 [Verrucomicrobiota bacterium]
MHGNFKGSFYVPKGGTYYLQLNSNRPEMRAPWQIVVAAGRGRLAAQRPGHQPDAGQPGRSQLRAAGGDSPAGRHRLADRRERARRPALRAEPAVGAEVRAQRPAEHAARPRRAAECGRRRPAPSARRACPRRPRPPSATAPPPAEPAPVVKLTEDQARAVVLIKGDKAEGTGFLVKTPNAPRS